MCDFLTSFSWLKISINQDFQHSKTSDQSLLNRLTWILERAILKVHSRVIFFYYPQNIRRRLILICFPSSFGFKYLFPWKKLEHTEMRLNCWNRFLHAAHKQIHIQAKIWKSFSQGWTLSVTIEASIFFAVSSLFFFTLIRSLCRQERYQVSSKITYFFHDYIWALLLPFQKFKFILF